MIVRIWTGEAHEDKAEEFRFYFRETVLPSLRSITGFQGVTLLERHHRGEIEFVVISRWDSYDAIRSYAGLQHEKSVLEEKARIVLDRYDETVKHYVLALEEGR
jgi:heme-degrading monooxygenase HmoA